MKITIFIQNYKLLENVGLNILDTETENIKIPEIFYLSYFFILKYSKKEVNFILS